MHGRISMRSCLSLTVHFRQLHRLASPRSGQNKCHSQAQGTFPYGALSSLAFLYLVPSTFRRYQSPKVKSETNTSYLVLSPITCLPCWKSDIQKSLLATYFCPVSTCTVSLSPLSNVSLLQSDFQIYTLLISLLTTFTSSRRSNKMGSNQCGTPSTTSLRREIARLTCWP